jgi:hypothetical protein
MRYVIHRSSFIINKIMLDKIKELGLVGGTIFVLGFAAHSFFPWWSIAVVAFLVGVWQSESALKSFTYGTLAVTLLWTIYAGYQTQQNGGLISEAVGKMLGGLSGTQLLLGTGLIGGIVGGIAAMTGTFFRQVLTK